MTKVKAKRFQTVFNSRRKLAVVFMALMIAASGLSIPLVGADQYDDQIKNLQQQNGQSQAALGQLQVQANSFQDAINKLQAQISDVQQQLAANQAKQADLQKQITAAEEELAKQKLLLGDNIRAMYLEGDMSTVEMLASSKNLSEFVDKQQYRNSVQDKIKTTLDKITQLKLQLAAQKQQVDQLVKDEQAQNAQLAADQQQQSQLLAFNQQQQGAYTAQLQANNAQIASLRAAQAAAYRRTFTGSTSASGGSIVYKNLTSQQLCGGGYNFHCADSQDGYTDYWGLWNRECVSYTAWYEANAGHNIPYHFFAGVGNANQWEGDLRGSGVASVTYGSAVSSGASVTGDIVYMPIGGLGHVGAVLYDEGNGWVRVGQYNIYDQGMYSEMDLKITSNLVFFHFN